MDPNLTDAVVIEVRLLPPRHWATPVTGALVCGATACYIADPQTSPMQLSLKSVFFLLATGLLLLLELWSVEQLRVI